MVFSSKCTFFFFFLKKCYLFSFLAPYFSPFSLSLVHLFVTSFNAKPAHHQAETLKFSQSVPCLSWQSRSPCHAWAVSFRTTCWITLLPSGTPACRYSCSGSWRSPQQAWICASRRHGEISGQLAWEFRSVPAWQHRDTWKGRSLAMGDLVSRYWSCVWTL